MIGLFKFLTLPRDNFDKQCFKLLTLVEPCVKVAFNGDLPDTVNISMEVSTSKAKAHYELLSNTIVLNRHLLTFDEMFTVVVHELIHVSQCFRGDLSWSRTNKCLLWKNKRVMTEPWEDEAFGQQEQLAVKIVSLLPQTSVDKLFNLCYDEKVEMKTKETKT